MDDDEEFATPDEDIGSGENESTDGDGNIDENGHETTKISFEPDESVLTKSATWTIYKGGDSRLPLCVSFSELIDNSLSATVTNPQLGLSRDISVRYYHNEAKEIDSVFMVADNGIGLNVETLKLWAIYKLSKDKRRDREMAIHEAATPVRGNTRTSTASDKVIKGDVPGFLNSNLSKFGAGGKEAAFFVGKTVYMMTRFRGEDRVHIIELSEKEFERKKKENISVYSGEIKTRNVGDSTGVDNKIIKWIIENEEEDKPHFAHCIVTTIHGDESAKNPENQVKSLLKNDFFELTCGILTDVYHYYLHGPKGNFTEDWSKKEKLMDKANRKINLDLRVFRIKKDNDEANYYTPIKERNLRTEDPDDFTSRTLLIRAGADNRFEFKGEVTLTSHKTGKNISGPDPLKKFEGVIYYYPYLYDRETYPITEYNKDHNDYDPAIHGRGKHTPIFDCYWNGRFIPNSKYEGFDFMVKSQKKSPPDECYNRIAGVMFFNDAWTVTQNKQTFESSIRDQLDLSGRTSVGKTFNTVTISAFQKGKWVSRGVEDLFRTWLQECHERYDKKIVFSEFMKIGTRTEKPKADQYPWSMFKTIEWDRKKMTVGQLVMTNNARANVAGRVVTFWAKGDYSEDVRSAKDGKVCASGGEVTVKLEPSKEPRAFTLAQINKNASNEEIMKVINAENDKMPSVMIVEFPEWEGEVACPIKNTLEVSEQIGPFQVDILNKQNKSVKGNIPGKRKKLVVNLNVHQIEDKTGKKCNLDIISHSSNAYSPQYAYWFEKMAPWKQPGKYKITISCTIGRIPGPRAASSADSDDDTLDSLTLPEKVFTFTVTSGPPANLICEWDKPIRLLVPFEFPFHFADAAENPILDNLNEQDFEVKIISEDGRFELNDKKIKIHPTKLIPEMVTKFTLLQTKHKWSASDSTKIVKAILDVKKKNYQFPKLQLNFKTNPGKPDKILAFPDSIEVENGNLPRIGVKVFDKCNNLVTCDLEAKLTNGITVDFHDGSRKLSTHTLDIADGPDGTPTALTGSSNKLKFNLGKELSKEITARIYLKDFKNVNPIERIVTIKPSCRPTSMKLSYQVDIESDSERPSSRGTESIINEIKQGEEIEWIAGEMMKGITFKLYDEAGKLIESPTFKSNDMKISWKNSSWVSTSGWKSSQLVDGKLPPIKSPLEAGEILECYVAFFNNEKDYFSLEFKIKSIPGPPAAIDLDVDTGTPGKSIKINAGQAMDSCSYINVRIVDRHRNGCNLVIEEEMLDKLQVWCTTGHMIKGSLRKIKGDKDGEIYVSRIQFTNDTKLGTHALEFKYGDLKQCTMAIELIHGIPHKLVWIIDPPTNDGSGTIPIVRNSVISIKFQLKDEFSNNCTIEGIKVVLGSSPKLLFEDLSGQILSKNQVTDSNGIADYGKFAVKIKEGEMPAECTSTSIKCAGHCYGYLGVQARSQFEVDAMPSTKTIMSEKALFHIKCDSEKPVDFTINCDLIDFDSTTKRLKNDIIAGCMLPTFTVSAIAEDSQTILGLGPNSVYMDIMLTGVPDSANQIEPTEFNDETGFYDFNVNAPELIGSYSIKFGHHGESSSPILSAPVTFNVIPDSPFRFAPIGAIPEPWVSNTSDVSARTIASDLKFVLTDKYNNPIAPKRSNLLGAGDMEDDKFGGQLAVQITGLNHNAIDTLPMFTGKVRLLTFPIVNGECLIKSLELGENSPGEDGKRYMITFTPKFNLPIVVRTTTPFDEAEEGELREESLSNYEMTFGFSNNAAKQEQMRKLTDRRGYVKQKLFNITKIKESIEKETNSHKRQVDHFHLQYENNLTRNRNSLDESISNDTKYEELQELIRSKTEHLGQLRAGHTNNAQLPRFDIAPAPKEPGVVGKVIHLAKVESIEASRLLSWHIRNDLNCIVTTTIAKAHELDARFNNQQQVWPIESINHRFQTFDQNCNPLPHEKCRQPFPVTGNPRWALSFVTFNPDTEQDARIPFNQMLGNLVVMDTMKDATAYRSNCLKQRIDVGTILTLNDGRRMASSGKFGGGGNNAPPLTDQSYRRFGMFKLSPGQQELKLQRELNLLSDLEKILKLKDEKTKQLHNYKKSKHIEVDIMIRDQKKYESELVTIDQQLHSIASKTSSQSSSVSPAILNTSIANDQRPVNGINNNKRRANDTPGNDDDGPSDARIPRLQ